jgi:hypothetical protein
MAGKRRGEGVPLFLYFAVSPYRCTGGLKGPHSIISSPPRVVPVHIQKPSVKHYMA